MASHPSHATTRPEQNAASDGVRRLRIVADRSRVGFKVRKMRLYYVKGRFDSVRGEVAVDRDGMPRQGEATIDASSITTRIPPRDLHLRSKDFLEVKRYPQIRVRGEDVRASAGGEFKVHSEFDIHGERRPVDLEGHLHRLGDVTTLHLSGVIDRHDFGIRARQPFEMVVGDEIHLDVELALAPPA